MTLPAIETLCRALNEAPDALAIHFPGGATLIPNVGLPPSLLENARAMLGQANAALAPLQPIFDVIETLVAIQNCIKAIPDALGPPPDPSKLANCIPDLAEKVEALISLLPPASVLRMIGELLDTIIAMLRGTTNELRAVIRLVIKVTAAEDLSTRVPGLLSVANCGRASADAGMNNIGRALGDLGPMLELLNGLLSLAGLPEAPGIDVSSDGDPEAMIDVLDGLVQVLVAFRGTIPLG
jgi:hypothetical protein